MNLTYFKEKRYINIYYYYGQMPLLTFTVITKTARKYNYGDSVLILTYNMYCIICNILRVILTLIEVLHPYVLLLLLQSTSCTMYVYVLTSLIDIFSEYL